MLFLSSRADPSSSVAKSKSTSISSTNRFCRSAVLIARSRRARCWRTFCALSCSFQKSGAATWASIWFSSAVFPLTSKKPPQFLYSRLQFFEFSTKVLHCNLVKHLFQLLFSLFYGILRVRWVSLSAGACYRSIGCKDSTKNWSARR